MKVPALIQRIKAGDITPGELVAGVSDLDSPLAGELKSVRVEVRGVKAACAEAVTRINATQPKQR